MLGYLPAFKNWHAWQFENGFSTDVPNPTNEFVAKFYGVGPIWKIPYLIGMVVRVEDDDNLLHYYGM